MPSHQRPEALVLAVRKAICGCSYPCDANQLECRCLTRQRAETDAALDAIEKFYPGCWETLGLYKLRQREMEAFLDRVSQ